MTDTSSMMKTIRASSLPMLFNCPKQFMHKTEAEDYGKEAGEESAQTGSLVHLGIAAYHETSDTRKGVKAIELGACKFPLADVKKALGWFHKYPAKYATNAKGKVKFIEQKVTFALPGTKDETITVIGTVDLVVESATAIYVIDHKSGPGPADYMLKQYAPQIAAYMFGVWHLMKRPKKPVFGFVCRIQDLHWADGKFYHDIGFDLKGAEKKLNEAAALYELHTVVSTPGKHCSYCPLVHPHCWLTPQGAGGEKSATNMQGGTRRALTNIADLFKANNTKQEN